MGSNIFAGDFIPLVPGFARRTQQRRTDAIVLMSGLVVVGRRVGHVEVKERTSGSAQIDLALLLVDSSKPTIGTDLPANIAGGVVY